MLSTLYRIFIQGGIRATDSSARARSIRISNLINLSAIFNTLFFGAFFLYLGDQFLLNLCLISGSIYIACYLIVISGFPNLGRPLLLIMGNLIVFYFACIFRGQSDVELLFFSLSVVPFMHFAWEERYNYVLTLPPIILMIIGEYNNWSFFEAHHTTYDLRIIRVVSILATIHQIIGGYYYFLKQSVKYEAESNENLFRLEIEYRKQIQVQKLSSLGEMAGGISHEINNPLMVIIGKTYHLKRELKEKLATDDMAFKHLEKIDTMVHRITRIIRALKNFSRNSENDSAEPAPLKSILETTLDLCQERFSSAGIQLQVNAEEGLVINCRATEISQVLLNLLNNAFDAVVGRKDPIIKITTQRQDDQIEILVEDNGPGIPPEYVEKIMQPFFTTKEIGKGTGLGLSISKGLIEGHKGSFHFLEDREWTTFQVLLPASP